jgi:hypothetical protein
VKVKYMNLSRGSVICFFSTYVVFTQILISIVQLYIIQLYVSKFPCGTHTRSNWKCNVIFERECVIIVCL